MATETVSIEVIYATANRHILLSVSVPPTTTLEQAIQQSGILDLCPEIDLTQQKVGIFSQILPLQHVVKTGDRIEIYRPLSKNPMDVRRDKARG